MNDRLSRPQLASAEPSLASLAGRWAAWALSIADRFRGRPRRGVGAPLVFQRLASQCATSVVHHVLQRSVALASVFAPRIRLAIAPVLRFETLARPSARRVLARTEAMAPERAESGRATAPVASPNAAPGTTARPPLASALARNVGAGSGKQGGFRPALAVLRREAGPAGGPFSPLALVDRLARRGRRLEAPPPGRPARTLHRPSPPAAPPVEAPSEVTARSRRHAAGDGSPLGAAAGAAARAGGGLLAAAPAEIDRLTDQVVRRIDRRMTAWRERTGRLR